MNIQAIQNLNIEGLNHVSYSINNVNHIWASMDFIDNHTANNFFINLKKLFKANGRYIEGYVSIHKRFISINLTILSRLAVK